MNLEHLIDQFELVTDSEEGLEQLRELILNLAVRGKLTKQDPNDEPAEKLIQRIDEEKQRLYDKGEIRKPQNLDPISEVEKSYKLPDSWKWSKIGNAFYIEMGQSPPSKFYNSDGEGLPFYQGKSEFRELYPKPEKWCSKPSKISYKGDVLISVRAPVGPTNICQEESCIGRGLAAIRPLCSVSTKYTLYCIRSFEEKISGKGSGSTFKAITKKDLLNFVVPIPPLEEQQRIVKKIEILFSQVDELEQKVQQDRKVDERLQVALLDDLQRAETPEASRQSWQRLTDHFEQIYRKPEHIDQLKQAILNEALRGRLVPQDPSDEPAEKLLERIKEAKQRLYEEGEIRKLSDLSVIAEEEIPYELPKGWVWERFGNLGVINPRNNANDDIEASFVPMKMISENFSYEHEYEVKKWKEIKSGYTHFAEGDIGLAKITPCFENGKAAIFQNLKNGIGAGTTELYIFRPINNTILNRFAYLYLQTPKFRVEGKNNMTGTAGQQRVPKSYFEEALFPLPPFNEQKRIIEKIYDLFAWCDDLKEKLRHSQQTDQRLLEALVNGELDNEESKDPKEATIYQMPKKRVRDKKLAKVSGMSTTDVQAGIMARVMNGYERYSNKKEHLGRTKMEKMCHIIETHTKIDLGRKPKRMQFGSADYTRLRNKVEPRAKSLGWFNFEEDENGVVYYKKGTRFHEPFQKLGYKLMDKSDEIDRIIELFVPLSTRDAEVRQTVYAAWHDLLAFGKEPTDNDIVMFASTEKYWAKEKEKIPKKEFFDGIQWLKKNNLVPDGRGKLTLSNKNK